MAASNDILPSIFDVEKPFSNYGLLALLVLVIAIVYFDQATKAWAEEVLSQTGTQRVNSLLNWTLSYNEGAAFSMFSNFGGLQRWFLAGISLLVSIFLVFAIPKQKQKLAAVAMTFVLAGAVGNMIDRFATGRVVDFISTHYENYYFAIFNIADMSISFGAFLLIIYWLFFEKKKT